MIKIGTTFQHRHAAGVTEYRIDRQHRDAGYYECVASAAISGTHHMLGSIHIFAREDIERALKSATPPRVQFLAFVKVASTPEGAPVYSVADIIEPLPRYAAKMLRSARLTAGFDGYVLVRDAAKPMDHENDGRRIDGLWRTTAF